VAGNKDGGAHMDWFRVTVFVEKSRSNHGVVDPAVQPRYGALKIVMLLLLLLLLLLSSSSSSSSSSL